MRAHLALGVAARPHRLALLVPTAVKGWDWRRTFEVAMAAQTRVWGGQGNLLLPLTEDFTEHEVFWRITEIFDPDAFLTFAPSWREVAEIAPEGYESERKRLRGELSKRGLDQETIERSLTDLNEQQQLEVEPNKEQLREIRDRLAPFHYHDEDLWSLDSFDGSSPGQRPFADVTGFKDLPERVLTRALGEDSTADLLVTAHIGRVSPALVKRLRERGVATEEAKPPILETAVRDRWRGDEEAIYPWDLSTLGASVYLRGGAFSYPGAVVVGDDPWDFALYYALHRLTASAWWLPSDLEANPRYMDTLRRALEGGRRAHKSAFVVSTSAPERCQEIAAKLGRGARKPICRPADWREAMPEHPQRIYSRDDEGLVRFVPAEGGTVLEIDTPEPTHVECESPAELRWVAEIRSPDWAAIRQPGVAGSVLRDAETDSDRRRVGRDGVAYFATRAFIHVRASLKSVIVRPELRAVPLLAQLRSLLEPEGWTIEPSDKGIYARESAKLLGGFDGICEALRDPAFRRMTDVFRAPLEAGVPGLYMRNDSRRYLRWADLGSALGLAEPKDRIDELLEQGVLSRGLVLKCGICRAQEWHRLGRVSDSFYCDRCGTEQPLLGGTWGPAPEPDWTYRLAEVVHQLLEHHGELPLLAVYDRFGKAELPLTEAFELDFVRGEIVQELDIACASGSRLVIGEANITGRLDADRFQFLQRLAEATGAREILLATSAERWSPETEKRAAAAFPGFWPELVLRTGVEIGPRPATDAADDVSA